MGREDPLDSMQAALGSTKTSTEHREQMKRLEHEGEGAAAGVLAAQRRLGAASRERAARRTARPEIAGVQVLPALAAVAPVGSASRDRVRQASSQRCNPYSSFVRGNATNRSSRAKLSIVS